MEDFKNLRCTVSRIAFQQFDWGLATYLRAYDNGCLGVLEQHIAEQLDKRSNANRTMMHGLFYLAGVKDRTTVSTWTRAAEFVLPRIQSTEDIQKVAKEHGGIRKCADRARSCAPNSLGGHSHSPATTGARDNGGKDTNVRAKADMDGDISSSVGKACAGARHRSPAGRHKRSVPANNGAKADLLYLHFELPDDVHRAFRLLLSGDETDAMVHVSRRDGESVTVISAACVSPSRAEELMNEAEFEE